MLHAGPQPVRSCCHRPKAWLPAASRCRGAKVSVHSTGKTAYLQLGTTWVSFDSPETLGLKIAEAKKLGLCGIMVRPAVRAGGGSLLSAVQAACACGLHGDGS